MMKPATTAVYSPACGGTPYAIAKAICEGQRDQADRHAGDEIQREVARGVVAQALNAPRDPLFGHARAENLKSKPLRAAV
jgi:hypothetical protein